MKRRYSDCIDCLPSPEYSEPEYQIPKSSSISQKKKSKHAETCHDFVDAIDNTMIRFIFPGGEALEQKYIPSGKNLVLVFFGIINDFLDPISESYSKIFKMFNTEVVGVSTNLSMNAFNFPLVNGSGISKKFNVLDPVGGGVYPRDVFIIFDKNGKKRYEIPIRLHGKDLHDRPVFEVLVDLLEELQTEMML